MFYKSKGSFKNQDKWFSKNMFDRWQLVQLRWTIIRKATKEEKQLEKESKLLYFKNKIKITQNLSWFLPV